MSNDTQNEGQAPSRWRSRSDQPEESAESPPRVGESDSGEQRPAQSYTEPSLDPLPAVADDELSGVKYAIERVGLAYYRGCRAVASAVNKLKQMGD